MTGSSDGSACSKAAGRCRGRRRWASCWRWRPAWPHSSWVRDAARARAAGGVAAGAGPFSGFGMRAGAPTSSSVFPSRGPDRTPHPDRVAPVEAISVVAEETREPVKRFMRQISDELSSGLDRRSCCVELRHASAFRNSPCSRRRFACNGPPAGHLGRARQSLGTLARPDGGGGEGARLDRADAHHTMGVVRGPGGGGGGPELPQPGRAPGAVREPGAVALGVGLIVVGLLIARGIASRIGR